MPCLHACRRDCGRSLGIGADPGHPAAAQGSRSAPSPGPDPALSCLILRALLFLLFGRATIRESTSVRGQRPRTLRPCSPPPGPTVDAPRGRHRLFPHRTATDATSVPARSAMIWWCSGRWRCDPTALPACLAIDQAQWEINAEYYLIKDDDIGRWFRDRLIVVPPTAASRSACSMMASGRCAYRATLDAILCAQAARRPVSFSPLRKALMTFSQPAQSSQDRGRRPSHVGFTGGINICNEHSRAYSGETAWNDVHLRIEGPAVNALFNIFCNRLGAWVTQKFLKPQADKTVRHNGTSRLAVVPAGPDSHGAVIHRLFFTAIGRRSVQSVRIVPPTSVPMKRCLWLSKWSRNGAYGWNSSCRRARIIASRFMLDAVFMNACSKPE